LIETNVALNMYSIVSIYNKLYIFSDSVLLDKSESLSSLLFFPLAQTFFIFKCSSKVNQRVPLTRGFVFKM